MKQYTADRLYELLPQYIRSRDAEQEYRLRGLLDVIARQVGVVDDNIAQLYDNWFIETCEDWVVPYIGELIGYEAVERLDDPLVSRAPARDRILFPRRVVGKTLHYRARKGTLSVLAELAMDVTGWVTAAVEFYGRKPAGDSLAVKDAEEVRKAAGIDLSNGNDGNWVLDENDFPIDQTNVGLFVWRKRCYPVTSSTPNYVETQQGEFYTFSPLGNNTPLHTKYDRRHNPGELQKLPIPITRQMLQDHLDEYYGEGKSLCIYLPESEWPLNPQPGRNVRKDESANLPRIMIPADKIAVRDLSDLRTGGRPDFKENKENEDKILIDPETGRFVFPARHRRRPGREPRVTYHTGFNADIGGGEYQRPLSANPGAHFIATTCAGLKTALDEAIVKLGNGTNHILIEISDSGLYLGGLPEIVLKSGQTLQIRAANRRRPVIWIVEKSTGLPDSFCILPHPRSCFILDGVLIAGRGVHIDEPDAEIYVREQRPSHVIIRHSTLVPGWLLKPEMEPVKSEEASIELNNTFVSLLIQRSIVGSISVAQQDAPRVDPSEIMLEDSILDSTAEEEPAIYGEAVPPAYVVLTVRRSTILGEVDVRELPLAENSIFGSKLFVQNRQGGIVRYSYVPDGSKTPRRFGCPKDSKLLELASARYGTPDYCRLNDTRDEGQKGNGPHPIIEGGEYGGEMGVYYHLFDPVRKAILQRCLEEYLPVSVNTAIRYID